MKIFSSVLTKIVALFTITVFVSRFKQVDLLLSLSIFVQADETKSPDSMLSTDAIVFLFLPPFSAWQEINLFISNFLLTGDSFLHTNTDGNAMVFQISLTLCKGQFEVVSLKMSGANSCMFGNLKILTHISSYGHYPFVKHFVLLETWNMKSCVHFPHNLFFYILLHSRFEVFSKYSYSI